MHLGDSIALQEADAHVEKTATSSSCIASEKTEHGCDVTVQNREFSDDEQAIYIATSSIHETHFAPVDKGFGAWSFLIAAFLVEVVVWGFPNAYGAFLVNYLKDASFATQKHASSLLPLVGPLSSGIMYCMSPLTYPLVGRYPQYRRLSMGVGVVIIFCSLFSASFAKKVQVLVVLQGVTYAIGGCLIYAPCVYYMSEWFVERRGLANGVIDAGTAVGGLALPLMLPSLLSRYGSAKTLRYLSIVELGVLCVTLPFVKARLPEAKVHGPAARASASRVWMKDRRLLFVFSANTLQGLGYFVPIVWLPTYASSLGLSASHSSLTLALLNGASVVGRLSMGMLSDRFNAWLLAASTLVFTCLATFILWGVLSYSLAGVLAFGIVYGCSAGGWTSMWTALIRPVSKSDPTISTSIFGILMFSRGVGNILSTPVSTALQEIHSSLVTTGLSGRSLHQSGYRVAGGQYESMIIYVGSCFAGATVIAAVGWMYEVRRRRA